MNEKTKPAKLKWGYLLLGILLCVTALIAFRNPLSDIFSITILFGITAVLSGIWFIISNEGRTIQVIMGLIDILLGFLLLFNIPRGAIAVPFVFALWFILESVFRLSKLKYAKMVGTGFFWLSLVINILCILAGIALLFNPVATVITISFILGFYFMLAGVESIVYAFSRDT
ncbi:HdeD family acid-resistance protein [Breznakiella homolactica]|uniref:DUF308 domain-containing protein n=1 Tax=Breznakiella homolactica TaxID=2798577 RepID=A0A7T7XMI8_9SPIR|nr:DUF308 domain-containing protein [Breznakiella homolactica]QQO08983.1 DUF308 domain-containing protein [Breznakiella homolactica]